MTLTDPLISSSHPVLATFRIALAANMVLYRTRLLWSAPRRFNDYVDRLEIGIIDFDPPSQQDTGLTSTTADDHFSSEHGG